MFLKYNYQEVTTDPKLDDLYKNINEDYGKLFDELGTLPQNQGRMVDPFRYTLTNTLDDGRRINEVVNDTTLNANFIGQRLNSYIPPNAMMSKGKYFDRSKLIDDFGKKGDADTLEFYMFEDNVSGRMTAVRKIDVEDYANKEDPFSGGKFEFSYKTEMNIKEAEMYMFMKIREKLERIVLKDKDRGKVKFGGVGYVEPGGKDYKELIFKLKGDRSYPIEKSEQKLLSRNEGLFSTEETRELIPTKTISSFPYRSPQVHFGTKNEFAHVRFKTRDLNGQKVLTVEEMQSDIVQDMMKNFGERVTDFPFKNNWYELVSKRLIRYAADNGFDAVAIPKGSTIASRYKQELITTKNIKVYKFDDEISVHYLDDTGEAAGIEKFAPDKEGITKFQKKLGKNVFDKAMKMEDGEIQDLVIDKSISIGSGKGKADLYDKAIPSFLKKYGKKWNAKVYDSYLDALPKQSMPVTIIQLTDDMKRSVQKDGQALFEIFGIGSATAVGANAVSDSIKNNTISEKTN
jgi:hypothetical protein